MRAEPPPGPVALTKLSGSAHAAVIRRRHRDRMTSTAQAARRRRAQRIAQLRGRVVATVAATFALALGAVAFDGSMGATTASTPATTSEQSTSTTTGTSTADDTSAFAEHTTPDTGTPADGDVLTTQQS
jgi:hypothetical protein